MNLNNAMDKITISIPGDKSITHRTILLSAIAEGISYIYNFSEGQDCLSSLKAIRQLGVKYYRYPTHMEIHGVGLYGLQQSAQAIDCGNSGTTMRLLMGLLSGANIAAELVGDDSLSKRPMKRVSKPLVLMGADIILSENYTAPVMVKNNKGLHAIDYQMPVASAQVKSAILLAGLYADGTTTISESAVTRDHTERLFKLYSHGCEVSHGAITAKPGENLQAITYNVPGDFSAAAFWIVAALIVPGVQIKIKNVGINPTRIGLLKILTLMGANIEVLTNVNNNIEPVADIQVSYCELKGITIPKELVSLAIDEFPIIFVAAACATGVTKVRGLAELRFKETDRISAMTDNLRNLGILVEELPDGAVITGGQLKGGIVNSFGDHRIAMAMAIANLATDGDVKILNDDVVGVSYPDFYETLAKVQNSILSSK